MPAGRPTDYTPELADILCGNIAMGKPLVRICEAEDMPGARTVYTWLRIHNAFRQNYEAAKEDQADFLVEEILSIADDPELEPADKRVRVDARKWIASKFKVKKYGDKQQIEVVNDRSEVLIAARKRLEDSKKL